MQNNEILPIIDKCSSFLKLQGVLAWCVHFKEKNPLQITTGNLTVAELSTALLCLVRKVQSVYFTTEIWCIERGQQLPDSINLLTLSPFLDERKILCVGGRLRHSNLPAEQKDPKLIPNNHLICDLIVKHYHFSYLHTGAEATLANIRTKFWIVNGRSKVKRVIKQCIKCLKVSAKGKNQMMADGRFIFKCRNPANKKEEPLTSDEMSEAETYLIKQVQLGLFHTEMRAMKNGADICNRSKVLKLSPFLDDKEIIRLNFPNCCILQLHPKNDVYSR
ncbi:integrase catalytic domain-containing protein [Trichonephila clavata]|uniref:Integrase catalytic domain-containing protein n=1 Tax=Trichonephila clavata TaxID=2740835 RepID=A0A8X6JV43_TRICU|nr:integrase catalytic domain-containing protein [Trichonephila clavata]